MIEHSGPFVVRLVDLREGETRQEMVGDGDLLAIPKEQAELQGPIVARVTLYRIGSRIEVQGTVTGTVAQKCGKCLIPLRIKVDAPLRAYAEVRPSRDHRVEEEVREDDVGIVYHDGQSVDLTEEVRQVFLLEVPWHAECKEECRGLCPTCGVNRNDTECSCGDQPIDHRWEALRKLSENISEE